MKISKEEFLALYNSNFAENFYDYSYEYNEALEAFAEQGDIPDDFLDELLAENEFYFYAASGLDKELLMKIYEDKFNEDFWTQSNSPR